MTEQPLKPTTTSEDDLHTAGQRRINLIWEYTQATIAVTIVLANIAYAFVILMIPSPPNAFLLANAFFLVIGFYFGRTNHARIGDTQRRPMDDR